MRAPKAKVDLVSIYRATDKAKYYIEDTLKKAKALEADSDKKSRLAKCECKSCYYIFHTRMGGAAMTDRDCGICNKTMHFSSTATNVVCFDCATSHQLCVQCGGDIDLKNRRTRKAPEIINSTQ